MLKQLSIYAENKKGALQTITNALYEAGINIWGSVTNDGPSTASTHGRIRSREAKRSSQRRATSAVSWMFWQ